ncbi:MAG: hypothetical protein AAF429_05850 [Pseudomonadota bacterium]
MNNTLIPVSAVISFVLMSCTPPLDLSGDGAEPTTLNYTEPNLSGLNAKGPYPNADDVCQLLAPNKFTDPVREEGRDLIACPKHEKGAIADRRGEGARIVAHAKHWTILSIRPVKR